MRTAQVLSSLIAELSSNCGDMFEACRACAVSPIFVSQWRKDDKDVDAQLGEAGRVGALRLESAAVRRAVHGVEKAVYFKGEVCGTETVYSDGLLQTLLKAKLPQAYGADAANTNTFNGPTQINIMPRADNYEQWLAMKDSTANRAALPAPDVVIEGEPIIPDVFRLAMLPNSPEFVGLGL